jgi:hypothetical protein
MPFHFVNDAMGLFAGLTPEFVRLRRKMNLPGFAFLETTPCEVWFGFF